MSRYDKYTLNGLRSQEMLLAALAECGFDHTKVEVHETPQTLLDYHGHARPEKAHVIIRRRFTNTGASNDIGFLRQSDGTYTAIVSDFDRSVLRIKDVPFVQAVTNAYGQLNADKAIKTLLTKTIPGLKLTGKIPAHARVNVEKVNDETRIKVVA